MLYNIYSVRDQGWERALVVARPSDRGRPEGDFVKWLGAVTEDYYHWRGKFGFECLDLVQRELKKFEVK